MRSRRLLHVPFLIGALTALSLVLLYHLTSSKLGFSVFDCLQGIRYRFLYAAGNASRPSDALGGRITLVFVICGSHYNLGMVSVKSAVAFSTSPLHLIIFSDKQNQDNIINEVSLWPENVKSRVKCDVREVWFPMNLYRYWWDVFTPCATERLFLPSLLTDEDAVIYVDADVLFLHPVEGLWRIFLAMNERQMAAMAPDTESRVNNKYLNGARHPFVKPFGLNSGVLLMNLTRMRRFGLERRLVKIKKEFEGIIVWDDQDLLNILFSRNPENLYTISCRWNYREEHCNGTALCTDGPVAVVHGSRKMVAWKREPAFVALHNAMQQHNVGESLFDGFIPALNSSLSTTRDTKCGRFFLTQLFAWRSSARIIQEALPGEFT